MGKSVLTTKPEANSSSQINTVNFKFLLLGDPLVGKSSLLKRYGDNTYRATTSGVDVKMYSTEFYGKNIRTHIWDPLNSARHHTRICTASIKPNGVIIVFDKTNKESFENVTEWVDEATRKYESAKAPIVLVGAKMDLVDGHVVDLDAGKELAKEIQDKNGIEVTYIEASAETGENVEQVFDTLIDRCIPEDQKQAGYQTRKSEEPRVDHRQNLITMLDQYIERIEGYYVDGQGINYKHGFKLFKRTQSHNRESNYLLAKQLREKLESHKNHIAELFSDYNIEALRNQIIAENNIGSKPYYFNFGIHSSELNKIIKLAQNETEVTEKSSLIKHSH